MTSIVAFYREEAPDYRGRWLRDIWAWDDERLEERHNYIQILFPNREPSMFNAHAPLLDGKTIAAFRDDPQLRANLARSFDRILSFYGLAYHPETQQVLHTPHFPDRAANWLTPYNHNFLRITRILKCLLALGLPERAHAFLRCLEQIYEQYGDVIGAESLAYWQDAVREWD
jgi:hypothetical protein